MKSVKRKRISDYEKRIIKTVQCSATEAIVVEEIMRSLIFHSTLDWQTREEFEIGAREAYAVLKEMVAAGIVPENYQRILLPSSWPAP